MRVMKFRQAMRAAVVLGLSATVGCGRGDTPRPNVPSAEQTPAAESASPQAALPNSAEKPAAQKRARRPVKIEAQHLPNAYRLHASVITGGQPDGDAAFAELAALGVRTVISVDGAVPAVELAEAHGLQYVHLPHGYDGVPSERGLQLAKAVRDLPGPVYIHCHHGKHRSPAAGAVACVETGLLAPDEALAVLETAGTSPNYRGLYNSVREARRVDDGILNDLPKDFPEQAELPPLAEAMVAIEHLQDQLKALAKNDWRASEKQADVDPAHDALLLREQFEELQRTDEVKQQPAPFAKLLAESETTAAELEAALRLPAGEPPGESPDGEDPKARAARVTVALEQLTKRCAACHQQFRDVPLGEKPRQ
jgi:protein tyrosine phosphatase (PTP) superfamily phosphohydrolase (DUF442 family)